MKSLSSHPSPERNRVGKMYMLSALLLSPASWVGQMISGQVLSAYACYPHDMPLANSKLPHIFFLNLFIGMIALLVCFSALFMSYGLWKKVSNEKGQKHRAVDTGEGRTRFLAVFSLMICIVFTIAVLFTTSALFLVAPCQALR